MGSAALLVVFVFQSGSALAVDCFTEIAPVYRETDPQQLIHVDDDGDVARIRSEIIEFLWQGAGFPVALPDTVTHDVGSINDVDTSGMANLASIDKIDMQMELGFNARVFHLHPSSGINRLAVFHQGHRSDLNDDGGLETITDFLDLGYAVLAFQMPLHGPNNGPVNTHDEMAALESETVNPMRFFVEPIAVALNYVEQNFAYDDITMVGISGGGWTTTLYAAIDTRIRTSFSVAGDYPLYLREGSCGEPGDYEQGRAATSSAAVHDFYVNTASYPDLHLLGSHGAGRKQIQILNQFDGCCFEGIRYQLYESNLVSRAAELLAADYAIALDDTHALHQISPWARANVIFPEIATLDPTPPSIATALGVVSIGQTVRLTWGPSNDNESGVVIYRIHRSEDGGLEAVVAEVSGAASTWLDRATRPNVRYDYRITAVNGSGLSSSPSNSSGALTLEHPPDPPANLVVTGRQDSVALDWQESPEGDLAGYHVYRSETPLGPYTRLTAGPLGASAFEDMAVSVQVAYFYVVTAVDLGGNESAFSEETGAIPQATDPSLVAHWSFDDASGATAVEGSGNDHDGVLVYGALWAPGQIGGALALDGVDDYVATPAIPVSGSLPRTVALWIRPSLAGQPEPTLVEWGDSGSGAKWHLRLDDGDLHIEIGGAKYTTSLTPPSNQWSFVGAILAGPTLGDHTLFVNGIVETASGAALVDTGTDEPVRIGHSIISWDEPTRHFAGSIDDLRIYDRALSIPELTALYSLGLNPPACDTQATYGQPCSLGVGSCTHAGTFVCDDPSSVDELPHCDAVGQTESCNGVDDDCDGWIDEADALGTLTWHLDADTDGFGDPNTAALSCSQLQAFVADGTDCSDGDAVVWARPGEVGSLVLSYTAGTGPLELSWNPPAEPGTSQAVVYDLLRSPDASDFTLAGVCPESDDIDTMASDPDALMNADLLFYLVRAQNGCPQSEGSLGDGSSGVERAGRACP